MVAFVFQIIKLFSRLPIKIIYFFSSILAFFIWLIGYRKKVIQANLKRCFPELPISEINKIQKKFYKNLTDFVFESIKIITIPKSKAKRFVEYENMDIVHKYHKQGRNIFYVFGHTFNWELGTIAAKDIPYKVYPVYKKIKNDFVNDRFLEIRSKFGAFPIERNEVFKTVFKNRDRTDCSYLFLSDQFPTSKPFEEIEFFGTQLNGLSGYAKLAKRFNYPIIFVNIQRKIRGKYLISFENFIEKPSELSENQIVQKYYSRLQEVIKENPDNWLWSHNRWKN